VIGKIAAVRPIFGGLCSGDSTSRGLRVLQCSIPAAFLVEFGLGEAVFAVDDREDAGG
jgi:hypothetical protein